MSKYIRTKDNRVIELTEKGCVKENYGTIYAFLDKKLSHHLQNGFAIVKQADTIEELCDEFVGIIKGERFVFSNTKENELFVKEQNKYHAYEVLYGAIWTDKGLIYVAKMNDKGELELL